MKVSVKSKKKEKIEDIVLRHSGRGMDLLKKFMPGNYAQEAAKSILSWERGTVFLATGFYVGGYAETDGPAGTYFLALALKKLGFKPIILTDAFCQGFFDSQVECLFMPFKAGELWCNSLLAAYKPCGLISIERCGKNQEDKYANMRGVDISPYTAQVDLLFEMAYGKIPTVGVGDGGNEIGMGNVSQTIQEKLTLNPCRVRVSNLVIASVSNWGAYAIIAYLEKLSGQKLMMTFNQVESYIASTVKLGSVDGVLKEAKVSVDGFGMEIEREIIEGLEKALC